MRSLAARVVALVAVVALATALLTGAILVRAIRATNGEQAGALLASRADTVAERLVTRRRAGCAPVQDAAVVRMLRTVAGAVVRCATPGAATAVPAPFTPDDVTGAAADAPAVERASGGTRYLVVARPAGTGRVLLVAQPESDAARLTSGQRTRALLGALAGLVGGVLAGFALASTVTRPLRRLADAARALSAGRRDVRVPAEGPEEVADVARALDGLATALAGSEERQRQFLLAVSHELRTPLTAVTGYAEALADGVLPPAEAARAAGVVRDEAGRLQGRVADLLALARLEADDFRLEVGPVDALAVVRAAAAAWQPRAAAAGVALRTEADAGPHTVLADGERLRQAVDALCDNAIRILPGGAPLVLAVHGAGSQYVRVQVRDGGPGLAPEDLAVAFERGRLTQRYRGSRPVGSGLGLALVGELTHRMGGLAEALPAPEGGVAFGLYLPRA
ncbi:cell wall metabolism sensor histidine kinase WalK [Kineosporia sp. R_H_3]|uniref:sensor histidine kinase n=1 Tax=Kineosporia sp. R_H_3 TaxID=1961848 RepID=UPI000B4A9FCB|nr:HAMP domain-containing sensor histidine kinase [Kineosporia sp. R_H_3]